MNYAVAGYMVYLACSIGLTVWVGRSLFRHGRVFLVDAFGGDEKMADSVNHLLIVGFYLLNIGYVAVALKFGARLASVQDVFEATGPKIGMVMLILGAMHFFNLYIFSRIRRRDTFDRTTTQGNRLKPKPKESLFTGAEGTL